MSQSAMTSTSKLAIRSLAAAILLSGAVACSSGTMGSSGGDNPAHAPGHKVAYPGTNTDFSTFKPIGQPPTSRPGTPVPGGTPSPGSMTPEPSTGAYVAPSTKNVAGARLTQPGVDAAMDEVRQL